MLATMRCRLTATRSYEKKVADEDTGEVTKTTRWWLTIAQGGEHGGTYDFHTFDHPRELIGAEALKVLSDPIGAGVPIEATFSFREARNGGTYFDLIEAKPIEVNNGSGK